MRGRTMRAGVRYEDHLAGSTGGCKRIDAEVVPVVSRVRAWSCLGSERPLASRDIEEQTEVLIFWGLATRRRHTNTMTE